MMEIKSVGVVGHTGMVGHTVFDYYKEKGTETYGYGKEDQLDKEAALNCDVIFVCVPTPYRWDGQGFDASIVDGVLFDIATMSNKENPVVVIKSTMVIGTLDKFQDKYPTLKLLFNPEFLSEATCDADFRNPDRQFVGYTKQSYDVALDIINLLPESAYEIIVPAKEAELLKYINNMHGVLAVIEANHFYDVCQREGLDYERVIHAAEASKWVGCPMGRQYHKVIHKGYRGIGGACFPKDLNAWVDYCKAKGVDVRLLEAAKLINMDLLKVQDLTEAQAEKISGPLSVEDAKKL